MTQYVYLSGPITGLGYEEARYGWRQKVKQALYHALPNVRCLSPMRYKAHLENIASLSPFGAPGSILSSPDAIVARDRFDTRRSSLMFCNLLGATKISMGTSIELGWADAWRVPVVVCIEPNGNPHDHAMLIGGGMTGWRVNTLEDGIRVVEAVLGTSL